ncbi:MAG TPA: histidine kinase N-terminal 7TM domain-containing protein, partial [bacterium]|nr:histidine kinase N-terminal 7TM domain-containing protein [bacterium]
MTPRSAVLFATAFANGALSLYLFWRFRRHRIHRLLAALVAGSAGYGLFMAGLAAAPDLGSAVGWVRVAVILPYLTLCSLFRFAVAFGHREGAAWTRWMGAVLAATAVADVLGRLSGFLPTHLLLDGQQGWYPARDWFYGWVYAPVMLATVLSSLGMLGRAWSHPDTPEHRRQIGYLWMAFTAGFLISLFNTVPEWRFLACTAPLAINLIMVYALTRRRLLDVDLVLREGAAAALASLCLTGLCALLVQVDLETLGGNGWAPLLAGAAAFALLYHPLQGLFRRALGPRLGGASLDLGRELLHFSLIAQRETGLAARLEATLKALVDRLGLIRAEVLLQDREGEWRTYQAWPRDPAHGAPVDRQDLVSLALLARPLGLDRHELSWTNSFEPKRAHGVLPEMDLACLRFLDGRGGQAAFGLAGPKELYGALLVGAPASGRPLRRDEIDLLGSLAGQLAALVEQSALQGSMRQSDRLSAVGTLAGSIAHDLRNPLASVGMFVQMLPQRGDDPAFMAKFQRLVPAQLQKLNALTE